MASGDAIRELLTATEAAYQSAKMTYEANIVSREAAIRMAHEDGWSVRQIAAELDVSFGLIGRIIRRPADQAA